MPLRSMDAVQGDKAESRFLVGTSTIVDSNCLQLLRFHSDLNQWTVEAILDHATPGGGGIDKIATHPTDCTKVLTMTEPQSSSQITLWKIPTEIMEKNSSVGYLGEEDVDDLPPAETASLEELCVLKGTDDSDSTPFGSMVDVQWKRSSSMVTEGDDYDAMSSMKEVMTLDRQGRLTQWDVGVATATSQCQIQVDVAGSTWNVPPRMSWDPHHADCAAIAIGTQVQCIDWRSSSVPATATTSTISGGTGSSERFPCHRYGVTDFDYNPNKPHVLVTSGQEGLIKFWDLRSSRQPLLTVSGGHSHWLTQVSYNPFHDQLVMSAGTDSIVNLWRISSISSAPLLTLDDDDDDENHVLGGEDMHGGGGGGGGTNNGGNKSGGNPNVRVSRFEHMDSVYATAWGASDAWIYASAGYDGKVVLSHVPSKEKYKILL